jgi:hypothetical protein
MLLPNSAVEAHLASCLLLHASAQVANARSALEAQLAVVLPHQLQQPLHNSWQHLLLLLRCCWRLRPRCCCRCCFKLMSGCLLLLWVAVAVLQQLLASVLAMLGERCKALHRRLLRYKDTKGTTRYKRWAPQKLPTPVILS